MIGCALQDPQLTPVNREGFRTAQPAHTEARARSEGSLYAGETRRSLLFVDRKAHLINDIVTIRVVEAASATGEANTDTNRDSAIAGSLEGLFGFEKVLKNNGVNPEMDGSGATSRKNNLRATITAVVREVFPNGNLYI
jgi:flagellar L-ring protein precursor FlgH